MRSPSELHVSHLGGPAETIADVPRVHNSLFALNGRRRVRRCSEYFDVLHGTFFFLNIDLWCDYPDGFLYRSLLFVS
jgi:hypothetical protein